MKNLEDEKQLKHVFRNRIMFWAGIAVRVVGLFGFGSYFLRDLFIPFVDFGVTRFPENPWANHPAHFFPYGSFLYAVLFVPKWIGWKLFGEEALGGTALSLFLLKAPLLSFDLLAFRSLRRFARGNDGSVLAWYWLNPVLIYITYFHGQLDIVSMSLTLASLWCLIRNRLPLSAIIYGLALSSKFHVAIVAPFVLAYLWNRNFMRDAARKIVTWGGIAGAVALVGFVPLLSAGTIGQASLTSPEAFRLFALKWNLSPDVSLYLGFMAVCAVLARLVLSTRIGDRGLLLGSGLLFGTLLMVTDPMPGWYFWVLPFVALFAAIHVNFPRSVLSLLQIFYFAHFLAMPALGFDGASMAIMKGFSLSLLQLSLGGILIGFWYLSVKWECPLERRARPLLIGLAGDSGVGKNRFAQNLLGLFGADHSLVMEGDDYHKWERGAEHWERYTHLNPRANHLLTMSEHMSLLTQGLPVLKSHYDHDSGKFTLPHRIRPHRTIIVQGLHALYLRQMRERYDLRVFIDPDPAVRLAWKLKRDMEERGHSREKVLSSLAKRQEDSVRHIDPQRKFADWIIEPRVKGEFREQDVLEGRSPQVFFRHVVWNDAPIGELIDALKAAELDVFIGMDEDDIDRVTIDIQGSPSLETVRAIGERVFPNLRHITRAKSAPHWAAGTDGVNQLFALALLNPRIFSAIHEFSSKLNSP